MTNGQDPQSNQQMPLFVRVALDGYSNPFDRFNFHCWSWNAIDSFGRTKLFRSSLPALFVVPLVAKLLEALKSNDWIRKNLGDLELPFNLKLLFAAAVCASIGQLLYYVFCPRILAEFADYDAFRCSGRSGDYLKQLIGEVYCVEQKKERFSVSDLRIWTASQKPLPYDILWSYETLQGLEPVSQPLFHYLRDVASNSGRKLRKIVTMAYLAAFGAILLVFLQNCESVFCPGLTNEVEAWFESLFHLGWCFSR